MDQLLTPDSVLVAMKSGIPEVEWLLGKIESEQGWFRFPDVLSRIITNLKIDSYPLLYSSEVAIAAVFLRGWMTEEEIRQFDAEVNAATPEERGQFLAELCKGVDETIDRIEIPKTPEQLADAQRRFDILSPDEQRESIRFSQHFFCFFLCSGSFFS